MAGALLLLGGGGPPPAAAAGEFVLVTEWGEFGGAGVAKIDPSTDQIIARASIAGSPRHMAADTARRLAYVSLHYGDKIAALKVDTLEVADLTIPGLGRAPIGATLTPDGLRLLVATRGDDGVYSADDRLDVVALDPTAWPPTASLVTSISTGLHPIQAIVDSAGRYAVVTVRNQPAILVVDLTTYQVVWQAPNLPADAEPEGGDAHPTQNVVYVTLHGPMSTIEVIDLDLMTITQHVPITNSTGTPTRPSTVRFTPDGSRAYVSGQTINRVLMFDTSDPRNPVQDTGVELPVGPQPHDIVWLPGDRAYVANTNNMQPYGSLSIISDYSAVPSVSGPILTDLAGPLSFAYFDALTTPTPTPAPTPTPSPSPAPLPYESSPFGFHPASTGALPNLSYSGAQDIGVRWHRPPVYAFWFLVQPNLGSPSYDWTLYDDQYGSVPAGINILANITVGPESEGYSLPGSYLPVDTAAYQAFVRATVERYDGDGLSDMPGLVTPIRYWQVDNEPNTGPSTGRAGFAQLQALTFAAIKDACPGCKVVIGGVAGFPQGYVADFLTNYAPILTALNGQYMDIFDFHWYGNATGDYRLLGPALTAIQAKLQETGFGAIPIWVTEMGTYSGDPAGPLFPYQSEEQQAGDLLKRFVHPISLGIEKVFPAFGLIEGFKYDDGYFDHTGLIYDGQGSNDRGYGVKKVGYYTYKLMTQKLEGATFGSELTGLPANVYGYAFTGASGNTVTVLWYDNFSGGPATQDVTLPTSASSALVTNAVTDQQGNVTSMQVPVTGGAATITLGGSPVFVEASSAITYTTETIETWVTAPSGNRVYTRVVRPVPALYPGQRFPAMIAIPGGTGAGAPLADNPGYRGFAASGFVVAVFNPEGRGSGSPGNLRSEGAEDCNGFVHQDDLKAVIEYVAGLSSVDSTNIGVETASFGIAIGGGALGRYPNLPVAYLVDQEGPHDNRVITFYDAGREVAVCGHLSTVTDPSAANVAYWAEREAVRYIGGFKGRYLRMQAEIDHAQNAGYYRHTIDMVNGATHTDFGGAGDALWTRVNGSDIGNTVNAVYPAGQNPVWVTGRLSDHPGLNITYDMEMAALADDLDSDGVQNLSDPDDENDGFDDATEAGTPLCGDGRNEDNQDDTVVDDGCPGGPPQAGTFSEAGFNIGTRAQDPCGTDGWPLDFVSGGIPESTNRVNVLDITSFLAPARHLDTAPGQSAFDKRWDLIPGRGVFNNMINVTDLTALIAGASGNPPMLGGARAFNGPVCPWAP